MERADEDTALLPSREMRGRLADGLAPLQQSMFGEARRVLLPGAGELASRLGAKGLAAPTVASILATRRVLTEGELDDRPLLTVEDDAPAEAEEVTCRLQSTSAWTWAGVSALLMLLVCTGGALNVVFIPIAAAAGYQVGRRLPHFRCTAPACRTSMKANTPTCPGCKRRVVRTILREADRLED
jgi:hypothetical protein